MATKFDMSDLGKLTYYLGIEVCQHENGITLLQRSYASKILEEDGMEKCNPVRTPMEQGLKLSKAEHEKEIDPTRFRKNIGCLRYRLHTRPDLSYSVGVLSRYIQSPIESHGAAMKQVLRYLRGSVSYGLTFERSTSRVPRLIGYSDSSYVSDPDDGRSTTGVEYVAGEKQKADILTKALGRIKFKEMRDFIGMKDLENESFKLKRENVGISLKKA
ncbi:uncharacterized mitochondrial protein AtMg00810-like [Brassica napus]|uniref:uncharacterized mitochondrial protein AtMg00810-like n=1 Tax=Brassica napus TaxID=3708 RepID=UPI0006AADF8E|nr:uncharacterized mitochondrial protein AtMg00810-like [Brassica napus]